ncbi:hypothetical protein LEP1GSC127_2908 [Leptospira kirschneri str. 200801925]|nr:hypothetical protein LEP1GSC044_2920 [Leptospira kirschneri serovar Grippotyphosa str. RM52]EKP06539.1 hypothetical protein LEP1GSC018_2416 [Leptospira kirschneri str. 2008720114]EKQ82722.1 hypothetical protein LEP1GSC064_1951 [Leptospira kirschneri serovar Grippotyphosa str. Moskva]EKR07592.1 hypothetical protein LEP1GSC122_2584 [Leptospira kirschneri serovar Valbuzzi str. 200702274]EMK03761.1 hypothetical protein LEP1GSC176_2336 [Leptospira kirschneri str. MMD1493]EMO73895.1 hypothetical 
MLSSILILKSSSTCGVGYDRERLHLNRFRIGFISKTFS